MMRGHRDRDAYRWMLARRGSNPEESGRRICNGHPILRCGDRGLNLALSTPLSKVVRMSLLTCERRVHWRAVDPLSGTVHVRAACTVLVTLVA